MRIIGGTWRGRKLPIADLEGLRPTGDRLRETLFNWLAAEAPGARCLDLFAGAGALGFEALSRGAAHCDFVELQAPAAKQLRANIELLGCEDRAEVWQGDALALVPDLPGPYDLIFLDPPFADTLHERALDALLEHGALAPGGLVYLEYPASNSKAELPEAIEVVREKVVGSVEVTLARATDIQR